MFPKMLLDIRDFLAQNAVSLSEQSRDGRINSAFNEDEILDRISQKFCVNRPNVRDWMDFSFEQDGELLPVNIKVSSTTTADNLNCKLGIYYVLSGMLPSFDNGIKWDEYFRILHKDIASNDKDYYFLIVNKQNPKDVFIASLRTLNKIVPNGNNLPFQAKWADNRIPMQRTYEEARYFILSYFAQSLALRANAYVSFLQYFEEYHSCMQNS